MNGYFNNVAKLFVKHYAENRISYLMLLLGTFAVPILMALLTRNSFAAVSIGMTVLVFDTAYVLSLMTRDLRRQSAVILETTLPVSVGERYGFILLNSTLITVLGFFIAYMPALAISTAVYPLDSDIAWTGELGAYLNLRTISSQACTHAIFLLIFLSRRSKMVIKGVIAILLVVCVQYLINEYVDVEWRGVTKMGINILVAVVAWVCGYFMLKRYQFKR